MRGYLTKQGYMGLVGTKWMLFATEEEYREYMEDRNED